MKTSSRKSKKNFLALFLSCLMVASGASAFAACDNGKGNSTSPDDSTTTKPTTSVNSNLKITNSDFETFNTNEGLNVIGAGTVSGWRPSKSSSGDSQAASGIVNVSEWDELTTSKYDGDISKLTEEEAKKLFETEGALTVKDKLAYYEAWKKANPNDKIATELKDFYESFNIAAKDLPMKVDGTPLENPLTHDYKLVDEEADYGKGKNVLMIHNQSTKQELDTALSKSFGEAKKYTSDTTVTVKAGTAATFSVWVKTMELRTGDNDGAPQEPTNKGAYINVTHSVGSKQLPVLSVKNINTQAVTDNNGWKQYTFYLKGSAYTDTTFTIVLGLGMGDSDNSHEYVNGYAFFDDIECKTVSYEKYAALLTEANQQEATKIDKTFSFTDDADTKTVETQGTNSNLDVFELNLSYGLTPVNVGDFFNVNDAKPTTTLYGNETVTSEKGGNVYGNLGEGFDSTNDVQKIFSNVAAIETEAANTNNPYLKAVYNSYFLDEDKNVYDFAQNSPILMLLSANGVAYTWESSSPFQFKNYKGADGNTAEYLAISFFVKTSDMKGRTGAGVTLIDGTNKPGFSAIDTTSITPVQVDLDVNGKEDKDVHDGWQQYFFFVENAYTEKDNAQFSLTFNFGPTTITGTTKDDYIEGFAAMTKFEVYPMSKVEYNEAVSAGTYAQVVSVKGVQKETATGDSGFDSAANVPSNALDEGLATPMNYMGVYSDSYRVNQHTGNGTHNNVDNYPYAGLLNKDSFKEYFSTPQGSTALIIDKLKTATGETTADGVWSKMFSKVYNSDSISDRTQPLLIWNTLYKDAENPQNDNDKNNDNLIDKAYGYIAKDNVTIGANTYKKVSVAVKVGALDPTNAANTFAYIYLIDADDKTYASPLSIGRNLTYWYDDKGNICADEDCEVVAFNRQNNGLYTVNKNWLAYKNLDEEAKKAYGDYFANLQAYTKDEATGNLLVAKGGTERDYSTWDSQGLDGIAFYYNKADSTYYARYDKDKDQYSVPVKDLYDVTKKSDTDTNLLPCRFEKQESKQLMAKVGNTGDSWQNVSFYIHTGASAKTYRLEVWSGERNGAGNPVDSYVAFDMNNASDAENTFTKIISDYENDKEGFEAKGAVAFESVFSWYDSASYLRYDKELDKNKYGDLYAESYTYSKNTSGTAYLEYTESDTLRIFADYSFQDVTVTPASIDKNDSSSTPDNDKNTSSGDDTNFFMLFSSIAIAAVLVFVIAVVVIRKILEKTGKLQKKSRTSKAKKAKKEKAEKTEKTDAPKAKEEPDEDSPYND